MRVKVDKVGSWGLVNTVISKLASEFRQAGDRSLRRFGLKLEGVVRKHISDQDLGWLPLKPATLVTKVRKGYSTNILVASSTYFQSITSSVQDNVVYVGVPAGTTEPSGAPTWGVAAVHEFGNTSVNIPARPLWRPSLQETLDWHFKNNRPEQVVIESIRKYFKV